MFAYIEGALTLKTPTEIWIDINGVGYKIFISLQTFHQIKNIDKAKIYIHHHIREDVHLLYGFFSQEEQQLFLDLISVSGIGANTARMMLSTLSVIDIYTAIINADAKTIESIKGIGKKTAERVILELKDKLNKKSNIKLDNNNTFNVKDIIAPPTTSIENDAIQTLVVLGIQKNIAEAAVKKALTLADNKDDLELLIKTALKLCN